MKRETFNVNELGEDANPYEWDNDNYQFVQNEPTGSDGEKGWTYYQFIVKRKSDNKFFAHKYFTGHAGSSSFGEDTFDQVFPKTITTTVYE